MGKIHIALLFLHGFMGSLRWQNRGIEALAYFYHQTTQSKWVQWTTQVWCWKLILVLDSLKLGFNSINNFKVCPCCPAFGPWNHQKRTHRLWFQTSTTIPQGGGNDHHILIHHSWAELSPFWKKVDNFQMSQNCLLTMKLNFTHGGYSYKGICQHLGYCGRIDPSTKTWTTNFRHNVGGNLTSHNQILQSSDMCGTASWCSKW